MKNKFTTLAIISVFFLGNTIFKAQDSKEILELKGKLASAKNDKEKHQKILLIIDEYGKQGKLDSMLVYNNKAILNAKKMNDKEEMGRLYLFLSQIYLQKADIVNYEKHVNEAENLLSDSKNYNNIGFLNFSIAGLNAIKKNHAKATTYYKKNIQLFEEGKKIDRKYIMLGYQGLFASNIIQSNFTDGYIASNKYIDFVKKYEPDQLPTAFMLLGSFYSSAKDYSKAINAYTNSIAHSKNEQFSYLNKAFLGLCYSEIKQLDSAKLYTNQAYEYFKNGNNAIALGSIYYSYATIYKQENKLELAEEYMKKALAIAPEKDIANSKLSYQSKLNEIILEQLSQNYNGNETERKAKLESLLQNLKEISEKIRKTDTFLSQELEITNYENLSKVYEILGNYEQALVYHKKYIEKKEKTYGLDKMKEFSKAQSNYELNEQKALIKLQEETKRIQLQKEIELKALRFEFEKKQAAAKTAEERERLLLEEDAKRKEIELTYTYQRKAAEQKYIQERKFAKTVQEKKDAVAKAELENSKTQKNMWAIGAGLSILLLGFAGYSYNQKRKDNKKIAEEKQKSDDLLLNILPYEVAEELKEKGKTSAKHFDEVSVLFTDFVNFTANSERIGVQEVLNELNICFTEFDRIMDKYGLEKIKTIGDAYLAVSGLPVSNDLHAKNAVNAGLEILSYIQQRKKDNPNALDIRIGIHSGPVIAGIVGVKKFAYDIWGDTVNTAARMEQNSSSGRVNISEATYQLIKDDFTFEHRGRIETKGKGAMDMYFVNQL